MKSIRSLALVLTVALLAGGCSAASTNAASGSSASSSAAVSTKAGGDIKTSLDAAAREHVARASRTVMPNKKKPNVFKSGKNFVARYIDIDTNNVTTAIRDGQKAKTYLGIVSYRETTMECIGKTKEAALKGPFKAVSHGEIKEYIHFDGKKWNF